jgi:hypothetical protein
MRKRVVRTDLNPGGKTSGEAEGKTIALLIIRVKRVAEQTQVIIVSSDPSDVTRAVGVPLLKRSQERSQAEGVSLKGASIASACR